MNIQELARKAEAEFRAEFGGGTWEQRNSEPLDDAPGEWFACVERNRGGTPDPRRMWVQRGMDGINNDIDTTGPFETRAEAEEALERRVQIVWENPGVWHAIWA